MAAVLTGAFPKHPLLQTAYNVGYGFLTVKYVARWDGTRVGGGETGGEAGGEAGAGAGTGEGKVAGAIGEKGRGLKEDEAVWQRRARWAGAGVLVGANGVVGVWLLGTLGRGLVGAMG